MPWSKGESGVIKIDPSGLAEVKALAPIRTRHDQSIAVPTSGPASRVGEIGPLGAEAGAKAHLLPSSSSLPRSGLNPGAESVQIAGRGRLW